MDFVKNQIQRIQQQLAGLTASQKMLTASLVAIMVMTLLYWGRYAGTADMVPLLEQAFSQQELGQIQARLDAKGIRHEAAGDRLLVPAERRFAILSDLAFSKLLPSNVQTGFDQMAAKLSPWASASERDQLYNRAKEINCSQVIGLFPDVETANVMIDPTRTRNITGGNIEPSASIIVTMRAGGASTARQVAEAAASVVAGANAGLKPAQINVTIDGKPVRLRQAGGFAGGGGDDQFELKHRHEQNASQKIHELLGYIPDLRVTVDVKVDNAHVRSDEEKFDKDHTITTPVKEEVHENETFAPGGATEPGSVPNVVADAGGANRPMQVGAGGADGDSAAGGGGGALTSRETTEKTETQVLAGRRKIFRETAPGEATVFSASVRAPRSYFVNVLRGLSGGKTPDDKEVQAYIDSEREKMQVEVRNTCGMAPTAPVSVATYADALPLVAASVPQTATASVPLMLGSHGKEIALGGLALVSLFMLMMMVRRSAPPVLAVADPVPAGPPPHLVAGEMLAGEAGDGNPMLAGMELDEDAVQTQQMLDQVSTMVKDNPDAAASLVKRWLNRD